MVTSLYKTLEQELHALARGISLECLVCGEFVLRRSDDRAPSAARTSRRAAEGEADRQVAAAAEGSLKAARRTSRRRGRRLTGEFVTPPTARGEPATIRRAGRVTQAPRKVRTPKGRTLGKPQAAKADGKWHRKETASGA